MNVHEHVFAAKLNTSFKRQSAGNNQINDAKTIDQHQLFCLLNQAENHHQISTLAYDFVCHHLATAYDAYAALVIHGYQLDLLAQLNKATDEPLAQAFSTFDNQLECLKQTAVIYYAQPCWLQNISQISCGQSKIAAQIMALYQHLEWGAENRISLQDLHQSLLLATGVKQPATPAQDVTRQAGIPNEMLIFASIQLALMRFPRLLFAEIIGFTLAFCQRPTLLEVCFPQHLLVTDFFSQRQQRTEQALALIQHCIADYLALFAKQQDKLWLRVQQGFFLYQQQMQCCRAKLGELIETQPTPEQRVARLLQQKAAIAIGHHRHILIDGISLDKWFLGLPDNCHAFLAALKKSDYVNNEAPEQSQLLTLFAPNGAMQGVLNDSERQYLLGWLKSAEQPLTTAYPTATVAIKIQHLATTTSSVEKYEKLNNRALYYYLINADLFPDVLVTAHKKIKKLLALCDFFCRLPFKKYDPTQFDAHIAAIYRQEMAAYRPLQGQPKISKAAYLWGVEQLAPTLLIDGCWLQNSLTIKHSNTEIAAILFAIYCDEIGNAVPQQNHAYIFQQLLDSLSIAVPPVYSKQFVQHPSFINSAFDLPTYMLALSHFSVQFLPELLGLNMAIELSGLGKSYLQLVDEWNYWGIDPSIVSIHIATDNCASGHTFLAKQAIKLYLHQLQQCSADSSLVDQHWRRVCVGYLSLRLVGARFKLALPIRYLLVKHGYQTHRS